MRTMNADALQWDVPDMENRLGFRRLALRTLGYVGVWLVLVAQFALVGYATDALRGQAWGFDAYLTWSFIQWSTLALLLPVALWLAPHEAIEPPHRWRLLWANFAVSLIFAVSAVMLGAVATSFVFSDTNMGEQLEQFLTKHVATDFLAYWVLVGVRQAMQFYDQRIRREMHAARLSAQLAQSRLQLLKMQLHPHFVFNTLHAAATLTREDVAAAEDMLLRLAELLRTYLDDERQEISLREELELVDLYLGIQRVRFKDRLTTRVDVDPELLDCGVPSLILQPVVENAIGHGIGRNIGKDCVEIDCYRVAAQLCIDVRNRNSMLTAPSAELFRRGIGLSNSRLRLGELYGDGGRIELDALMPCGAICRIRLPLKRLDASAAKSFARAA
ncbi:MAG: histidine kinase [Rudaea sp.]|uniref:sensor histidine kinase n=1 Tax=Rudaea sp. TaxID=2136325 RepID=UPI0039E60274